MPLNRLLVVFLAVGCRAAAPSVTRSSEATLVAATPVEATQSEPSYPELDYVPAAPMMDDGRAASGVPGYKRPGCSPLGPYEDEYLSAPGYDPTACNFSERMAKAAVGFSCGVGEDADAAKPQRIRCWSLSEKRKGSGTYKGALAELTACPAQRGGDSVQLPADAPLSVGTCRDGTRFLSEGSQFQHRKRFYSGETLVGISIFRGIGKGSDCRGEVNCDVVQEDGLCGTMPDKPHDMSPRRAPNRLEQ